MASWHTHPMDAQITGAEASGPARYDPTPPQHDTTPSALQIIVTPGGRHESEWPAPRSVQGEGYFLWHPDCVPQRLPQSIGWR